MTPTTCNPIAERLAELAAIANPPAGRLPRAAADPAWTERAWWWPWTATRAATLQAGMAELARKVYRA